MAIKWSETIDIHRKRNKMTIIEITKIIFSLGYRYLVWHDAVFYINQLSDNSLELIDTITLKKYLE